MRTAAGIAAAVVLSLVAAIGTSIVEAACIQAAQIDTHGPTGRSGIWVEGKFSPHYYPGYLPYDYSAPVTHRFLGSFWSLGSGDPAVGVGDDNGSFDVAQWFSYYGPDIYGAYFAGEISAAWNDDPAIDGCIANGGPTPGFDDVECAVVLLSDVLAGRGHYAVISRKVDAGFNAYLDQSGEAGIVLTPIDDPVILYATGFPHPTEPKLDVTLSSPSVTGAYLDPACGANVVAGYRVWVRYVAGGGNPPVTRERQDWIAPVGGAQLFTPGSSATVTVNLPVFPAQDIYFAYSLVFDSGFESPYVSGNSPRIACNLCWIDGDDDGWAGVLPFSSAGDPAVLDTDPGPDCDDGANTVFPGALQVCDGINNDCDAPGWPALAGTNEEDLDADAFSVCAGDCDDGAADVFPDAPELCDGRDNDCNALIDDDDIGLDSDADLVPNACDNCRFERNSAQSDVDSDAEGDLCDDDDGMVYMRHPAADGLSWQQELGFTGWNVYRGDLDVLRVGGPYTQVPGSGELAARFCGLSATTLDDPVRPASGQAAFYLVSGTAGLVEGDLGTNSDGATRSNVNPCP